MTRSQLYRSLRYLFSFGIIVYLLSTMDLGVSLQLLRDTHLGYLGLVFLAPLLDRLLVGLRLYLLLKGIDSQITFKTVSHVVFVSSALGYLTPGAVGAELLRIYGLSRTTSSAALALSSVLIERMQALLALMLLTLGGLSLAPAEFPDGLASAAKVGLGILFMGVAAMWSVRVRMLAMSLLGAVWLAPTRERLAKFFDSLDDQKRQPGRLVISLLLTFLYHIVRISQVIVASWALGLDIDIIHFFVIVPAIHLAVLMPISVAGIGVREAGFVYLFGLVDVSGEAALTLAILALLSRLTAIGAGVILYAVNGLSGGGDRIRASDR